MQVIALWPVDHASHARDLGSSPVRSGRQSLKKVSDRSVTHRALFHTFYGLSRSRMYLKTLKKTHSDSCRPAWLEIDRKICHTLLLLKQKEVELLFIIRRLTT